ncbi:MAG: NYN domain-containing protein [Bosea sp.]|nr:NYN domain-containing protein [Bosea sp. (in: a-proteobacteria)]
MTEILKSVLFIDYDSLHLALHARDPQLARRLAARPGALLDAIEAGALVGSGSLGNQRRRVLMRRCYADPRLIGRGRDAFVMQGFQIVDCPTLAGRERNSAEVQITLDTIDALGHPTAFDEFILLAAESDFSPLIYRLKAHNRAATIFAPGQTASGYRAIADGIIEEQALVTLLQGLDIPDAGEAEDEEAPKALPAREDLAALARRVHAATNVPLFPPKVYAELFRALKDEIAENGYHFLSTAENVAARLIASGRRASRRQIAFVVKGLALKGHVFSDGDTPEKLADVFREQVVYLARQAGIAIDPRVERQIGAWIAGGVSGAEPAPSKTAEAAPEVVRPESVVADDAPAEPVAEAAEIIAGPLEAETVAEPAPSIPAAPESAAEAPAEPVLAAETDVVPPAEVAEVVAVEAVAVDTAETVEAVAVTVAAVAPEPVPETEEELRALADAEDGDETADADETPPARVAPAVRPPVARPAPPKPVPATEAELDPFELSLLAAITEEIKPARAGAEAPKAAEDSDSDLDLDFKRILASLSENRK